MSFLLRFCPQAALPSVPPDTKLSKLDVLVLATNYIAYLTETLDQGRTLAEHTLPSRPCGYLHPVKVRIRANILLIHRTQFMSKVKTIQYQCIRLASW